MDIIKPPFTWSKLMVLTLAGVLLLVAAGGASAVTAISECQEITEPGEYYLVNDIGNSTADVCIYIKADDVVLDGNGYCIDGGTTGTCVQLGDFPTSMSGYARTGVAVKKRSNTTIKNVEVTNFCNGILLYGPSKDNTVEDCIVHDNGNPNVDAMTADIHGISLYKRVCNSTVNNNTVYNNAGKLTGSCDDSGAGIILKVYCNYNNVTNNTVYNNTLAGIYGKKGGGDCYNLISNNTVYQNGQTGSDACFTGGIRLQCKSMDDHTIEYNTVRDNFGPGIFIGGNDCTVRNNTATGNKDAMNSPNSRGDGLRIDRYGDGGGKNTQVYENTFCDNEHLDINVENTAQNVVGDNNTCDTCSNYNDYGETCCSYNCSGDVGCVAADGTVFGCGDTVTKSCVFNGDLNCETEHGLIIGADNITIDGDSYLLDGFGPGACDSFEVKRSGIYNKGYDGVLIRNLEIKNFCNGIHLTRDGGNYVCGNTIENCEIHHNGNNISSWSETHGIKMVYVFDSAIRNNSIHDQIAYQNPNPGCEDGGNGLFQYQGTCNNITENRFYNNAKAGMLIKMKPTHGNISHNHLWGNGQGGIILRCMLSNFNTIEHNNVSDNYGSGIFIGGNNNTIRYNTVCNNRDGGPYYEDSVGGHGYGIHIGRGDGSCNNTLTSNTVCGNDYLDMRVVTGVTGNTGDENTCDTTENYDDAGTTGCMYSCGATKGDLNGDGEITPADAMIALEMAARGEYSEDADVNRDQRVTSLDTLLILQVAAGV